MRSKTIRYDGPGAVRTVVCADEDGLKICQHDWDDVEPDDMIHVATPREAKLLADYLLRWAEKVSK